MNTQKYADLAIRNPEGLLWLQLIEGFGWEGLQRKLRLGGCTWAVNVAPEVFGLCVYHLGLCGSWNALRADLVKLHCEQDPMFRSKTSDVRENSTPPQELILVDQWLGELFEKVNTQLEHS